MKCYKCNRELILNNLSGFPIDPKGKNRRWVCTECASKNEIALIQNDVKDICSVINKEFEGMVKK